MKVMMWWVNFSTAFLLCASTSAFADDFHYNNLLIGDRASGMGGAYTAISDDASGMFYNPAGMMYVTDRNFSASVNTYSAQHKKYENVLGGQSFERKSSALLANYFGIVRPIGNFKFGFSYAVPDSVNEDMSQTVRNVPSSYTAGQFYDFHSNLNNRDNTINIGPSLATSINDDIAVGLTLYFHQRDVLVIQNQYVPRTDGSYQWINSYFNLSESGMKPILGFTWSPMEKLSLGLSLSKIFLYKSSAIRQDSCWDTTADSNLPGCDGNKTTVVLTPVNSTTSFDDKRNYPMRVAFGAAYFVNSGLLISSDIIYHTAVENPIFESKVATLDVAIGTEYYLNKKWALRAGLFSNVANTPAIQAGVTTVEEHINLYGGSLSFTHFSGGSSVTLGGSLSYGTGQAQIGTSNTEVQDATSLSWTMFLSSSF
jgi:long-chain fatty acid transport protein